MNVYHICDQPGQATLSYNRVPICGCQGKEVLVPTSFSCASPRLGMPGVLPLKPEAQNILNRFFGAVLSLKSKNLLRQWTMKCVWPSHTNKIHFKHKRLFTQSFSFLIKQSKHEHRQTLIALHFEMVPSKPFSKIQNTAKGLKFTFTFPWVQSLFSQISWPWICITWHDLKIN